jgi:hypothetical protein
MIEKIILAIVMTVALAWSIDIKPPQRAVAIEVESYVETPVQHQIPVLSML